MTIDFTRSFPYIRTDEKIFLQDSKRKRFGVDIVIVALNAWLINLQQNKFHYFKNHDETFQMHNTGELSKLALAVITAEAGMFYKKKMSQKFSNRAKEKICFRLTGFQKKSHPGGRKKIIFSYFFRNIFFLFGFSIHYVYLKWFMSIETSSWYIYSILKRVIT